MHFKGQLIVTCLLCMLVNTLSSGDLKNEKLRKSKESLDSEVINILYVLIHFQTFGHHFHKYSLQIPTFDFNVIVGNTDQEKAKILYDVILPEEAEVKDFHFFQGNGTSRKSENNALNETSHLTICNF